MSRLIDADVLMETIRTHDYPLRDYFNSTGRGMYTVGIQQAVDEQQTIDAVEVVRCKECKHWNECGFGMRDDMCHCSRIDYWTNADFFCADGKEKSDE